MNIVFTSIPTNTVIGHINIEDGTVDQISGAALGYLNAWQKDGATLLEFAEYYKSWSNGYVRSDSEAGTLEPTIAFTVDDQDNVLELIKSDDTGVFVRENADWTPVDTDTEQPTIDDQEWLDVNEAEATAFWDQSGGEDAAITREDVLEYALDSE